MTSFEDLLKEINSFGKYQKSRFLLLCFAALLPAIVTYIHSFAAAKVPYRCKNPYDNDDHFSLTNFSSFNNISIISKCSISYKSDENSTLTEKCNDWVFDRQYYETTLTEDWSMICDRAFLRSSVQTVYFSGYLIGSIVMGILADNYGRKPIMLSAFVMIILGSVGVAFGARLSLGITSSYIIYAVARFLIACGTRGINVTGFVLGMEMMVNEKRKLAGIAFQSFFGVGQLVLAVMAYFARDWETLSIIVLIFTIPFISYFFMLPESPRWLISNKRNDDARKILEKVAKVNKTTLNLDTWNKYLENETAHKGKNGKKESIIDAMKVSKMVIICSVLYLNWIIINFLFYGIGLKSSNLGVSPYLSFVLNGCSHITACFVVYNLVDRIGRKLPYCGLLFTSGIVCLSITLVDKIEYELVLAVLGQFCTSGAYVILYLFSSEQFPTSIRNSCMGSCSMMARIGSMMAPLVLDMSDWKDLPFLIFGICGIIGALSAVVLPETLKRPLPECLEDCKNTCQIGLSFKYIPQKNVIKNEPANEAEKIELVAK